MPTGSEENSVEKNLLGNGGESVLKKKKRVTKRKGEKIGGKVLGKSGELR